MSAGWRRYRTLGSDLEAFLEIAREFFDDTSLVGPSVVLVSLPTRRPVPVFLRPRSSSAVSSRDDGDTTLLNNGTLRRSHDVFGRIVLQSAAEKMIPRKRERRDSLALNNI